MAKLGSSSCRPLGQGMMLLALLLLASLQAAQGGVLDKAVTTVKKGGEILQHGVEKLKGGEFLHDNVEKVPVDQVAKTALASRFCQKPALESFCKGGKTGLRVHRYLCKAQGWMDKQNPGGASGTLDFAVDILGGDLLSKSFPNFSYSVTSNSVVPCRYNSGSQQVPPTMSFRITGISVGLEEIRVEPPAYLSTTTQPAYTNLEITRYGLHLMEAVNRQMKANPVGKPCYAAAKSSLPPIAIHLASDKGGVMQTMELSDGATDTVWYQESSMFCLGIGRTVELILGRP